MMDELEFKQRAMIAAVSGIVRAKSVLDVDSFDAEHAMDIAELLWDEPRHLELRDIEAAAFAALEEDSLNQPAD
jgi:hypothetical protein